MKKRIILLILASALLIVSISVTLAILMDSSKTVVNTFTVGNVNIELTETTGTEYKLTPGVALFKNPVVTVKAESESCWLFVKIQKTADFDNFCTFEMQDGWTALLSNEGVYYREVQKASVDRSFDIIKNNSVLVKDTLTEEQLDSMSNQTLSFTAYAVQSDGIATPQTAWQFFNQ